MLPVAIIQHNPKVGSLEENSAQLLAMLEQAKQAGAAIALCPELSLLGYSPRDLLDRNDFIEASEQALQHFVEKAPKDLLIISGAIAKGPGGWLYNQAIAHESGKILMRANKQHLPSYDVFDESRYFSPGDTSNILEWRGLKLGISICEDLWSEQLDRYEDHALKIWSEARLDAMFNLSASPFCRGKTELRDTVFSKVAKRLGCPLYFANQVGANDELIFDGNSTAWNSEGRAIARADAFTEAVLIVQGAKPIEVHYPSDEESIYQALVIGIRDYFKKCGFSKAVLGLSGGIDSALVAVLAVDALGPSNVYGIAMPSRYSSEGSITDASALAKNLGLNFEICPIDPIVKSYESALPTVLEALGPAGSNDVTFENVQARIRGAIVMAASNRIAALALTTGNKSELAVGYCTLYGDMCGGLAPISDLAKLQVYALSRFVNREQERIPESSITKAPSAELRPDQKDSDSLPDYEILDAILEAFVEEGVSRECIIERGFDEATVDRILSLLSRTEFKRRQAAPGLIVSRKAFGVGRRLPVSRGYLA